MLPKEILGRYEFTENYYGGTGGSHKFWHIVFDLNTDTYVCAWGRIGSNEQKPNANGASRTITYTEKQAIAKIKDKTKKGYSKKQGSLETIGEQSIHFINIICGGDEE